MSEESALAMDGEAAPVLREDVIEAVAAEIRSYAGAAMLEFANTVGGIILDRFYGGDLAAWRDHGPKHMSLRRLAEKLGKDSHLSASSLYRCVAIRSVLLRLGPASEYSTLSPSHVTAVLPLAEADQVALLREARVGGWSVRELALRARAMKSPARRGCPATSALVRAVRHLERAVLREVFGEIDRACALDRATVEELYASVLRIRERLDRLQAQLSPKGLGVVPSSRQPVLETPSRKPHRSAIGRAARD